jgi:hypothetical protein
LSAEEEEDVEDDGLSLSLSFLPPMAAPLAIANSSSSLRPPKPSGKPVSAASCAMLRLGRPGMGRFCSWPASRGLKAMGLKNRLGKEGWGEAFDVEGDDRSDDEADVDVAGDDNVGVLPDLLVPSPASLSPGIGKPGMGNPAAASPNMGLASPMPARLAKGMVLSGKPLGKPAAISPAAPGNMPAMPGGRPKSPPAPGNMEECIWPALRGLRPRPDGFSRRASRLVGTQPCTHNTGH